MVRKIWNEYFWVMIAAIIAAFIAYSIIPDPHAVFFSRAHAATTHQIDELVALMRAHARSENGSIHIRVTGDGPSTELIATLSADSEGKQQLILDFDEHLFFPNGVVGDEVTSVSYARVRYFDDGPKGTIDSIEVTYDTDNEEVERALAIFRRQNIVDQQVYDEIIADLIDFLRQSAPL